MPNGKKPRPLGEIEAERADAIGRMKERNRQTQNQLDQLNEEYKNKNVPRNVRQIFEK